MQFTAIDFETANYSRSSPCSVAVVVVKNGVIAEEKSWLINPEGAFEPSFIQIHGITPAAVAKARTFKGVWPELAPYVEGQDVVAHNMAFDKGVLLDTLARYGQAVPTFRYHCTVKMARRALPLLANHKLPTVAAACKVALAKHHDALEDARSCALIAQWMKARGHW